MGRERFACIVFDKLLSVAVVGSNCQSSANGKGSFYNASNACIDCLDSFNGCINDSSMSNHVGVGIIHNNEVILAAANVLDCCLGDACRAHLWLQIIGRNFWRWYQVTIFAGEWCFATTIDKIGDVGILLSFGCVELA